MRRIIPAAFLIALCLLPAVAVSGEWYCWDPASVISGKVDPVDNCHARGGLLKGEKPVGKLYEAALMDIFHGFKCPCILDKPGQFDVQTWQTLLDNLPRLYKKYPETRQVTRRGLMTSLAFISEEARQKFAPFFVGTRDEQLWNILSAAGSGDNQSIAKAFYQWCDNHVIVAKYVSFGHQPSLDELVAGREHPKLKDFGGSISCLDAQYYIYERLEKRVTGGEPVTRSQAELLTNARLRRLRNTVYARHGRVFENADLKNWFSKQKWYKPDPHFDFSSLTEADRQNIRAIVAAEQRSE